MPTYCLLTGFITTYKIPNKINLAQKKKLIVYISSTKKLIIIKLHNIY